METILKEYDKPIGEVSQEFLDAIPHLPPPYASWVPPSWGYLDVIYVLNAKKIKADARNYEGIADANWVAAKSNPAYWLKVPIAEVESTSRDDEPETLKDGLRVGAVFVELRLTDDGGVEIRNDHNATYWIPPLDPEEWVDVYNVLINFIDPL